MMIAKSLTARFTIYPFAFRRTAAKTFQPGSCFLPNFQRRASHLYSVANIAEKAGTAIIGYRAEAERK
jgi:hypothetical protein